MSSDTRLKQRPEMVPLGGHVADGAGEIPGWSTAALKARNEESPLDIMEGGPTSHNIERPK